MSRLDLNAYKDHRNILRYFRKIKVEKGLLNSIDKYEESGKGILRILRACTVLGGLSAFHAYPAKLPRPVTFRGMRKSGESPIHIRDRIMTLVGLWQIF